MKAHFETMAACNSVGRRRCDAAAGAPAEADDQAAPGGTVTGCAAAPAGEAPAPDLTHFQREG